MYSTRRSRKIALIVSAVLACVPLVCLLVGCVFATKRDLERILPVHSEATPGHPPDRWVPRDTPRDIHLEMLEFVCPPL